jgi:hypothetical protein
LNAGIFFEFRYRGGGGRIRAADDGNFSENFFVEIEGRVFIPVDVPGPMTEPPAPAMSSPAAPVPRSGRAIWAVAAVVVVLIVVLASLYVLKVGPFASSAPAPAALVAGGFTQSQVVTFLYTGNYSCLPALPTLFPGEASVNSTTPCVVGAADQNALDQVPEWILVPVFAGLSIFGDHSTLGADARGFPVFQGASLLTDCGAGGSPTGCPDHPTYLYSPAFTTVEQSINITAGFGGLPEGVLPTPAHDHLINTSATLPSVEWGTIVVLVFDPDIFPDRATGHCTAAVTSNQSAPTANCLNSLAALGRAMSTTSSSVALANGGSANNPIWKALGSPTLQVVLPGDISIAQEAQLNSNLYIPFAVQPGAPEFPG